MVRPEREEGGERAERAPRQSENQEEPVFTSAEGERKTETYSHYESMYQRGEGRKNDKNFEINKKNGHGKSAPFGGKDIQGNLDFSRVTSKIKIQQIDLFSPQNVLSVSDNWKVWHDLVEWAVRNGYLDSRSRGISYQVIERLKLGRKMNPWLKNEMERIWKFAINKGFKPEI